MYVSEGYKKVLGHGSPYIVIYFICPISVHYDGHVFSPTFVLLRVFFFIEDTYYREKERNFSRWSDHKMHRSIEFSRHNGL